MKNQQFWTKWFLLPILQYLRLILYPLQIICIYILLIYFKIKLFLNENQFKLLPVPQSIVPHTAWMVLIEDSSCTTDCDSTSNNEWIQAAEEVQSRQHLSTEPAIFFGSLDKNSIDSDSDLALILNDIAEYPAVKIFGCEICPTEIKQFNGEITQAAVVEQSTKIAAFNNPVISLDDDIFESVTDLRLDGNIVPYSDGSDFSWIVAVKKVPCNDCVLLEGIMNAMASDVATRTENQVKMAVIDADVNPLLSNVLSGDSNPMLWIVKPDGNKIDVSSQGSLNRLNLST